jgi:hypothetical protein
MSIFLYDNQKSCYVEPVADSTAAPKAAKEERSRKSPGGIFYFYSP